MENQKEGYAEIAVRDLEELVRLLAERKRKSSFLSSLKTSLETLLMNLAKGATPYKWDGS